MAADLQTSASSTAAKQAEKAEVKGYFETTGFERWNRIYSDSDEVNKVQRNIRIGHQKTVDAVLQWLSDQGDLQARSFCDAGCGVGSLTIPLALAGAGSVAASDLSQAMVREAERRAGQAGIDSGRIRFQASDLESLEGRYDTVVCLDVLEHLAEPAGQLERFAARLSADGIVLMNWYFFKGFDGEFPFHFDDPALVEGFFRTLQARFLEVFHPYLITTRAYRLAG